MRKCYIRQSGVVHFSFKKNVSKIGFKKTNQLYLITIFKCYLLVRLVFSLIMIIIIEQDCLLQGQAQLDQRVVFRFCILRLKIL